MAINFDKFLTDPEHTGLDHSGVSGSVGATGPTGPATAGATGATGSTGPVGQNSEVADSSQTDASAVIVTYILAGNTVADTGGVEIKAAFSTNITGGDVEEVYFEGKIFRNGAVALWSNIRVFSANTTAGTFPTYSFEKVYPPTSFGLDWTSDVTFDLRLDSVSTKKVEFRVNSVAKWDWQVSSAGSGTATVHQFYIGSFSAAG